MQAVKDLPDHYTTQDTLDLSSTRTALWLNLAAIPLLFVFGWIFNKVFNLIIADNSAQFDIWQTIKSFSFTEWMIAILGLVVMLILHELVHGIFFWLFTHERPKFALRSGYAFAAAPDWYLRKYPYIVVGLSPLVIISILCSILVIFVNSQLIGYLLLIATFNAAGALGDMIVVAWVIGHKSPVYVRDQGDSFSVFSTYGE
ncbi:MAG: hypothetical protein C3F13_10670 [Anaerolineales bacterium]|nr:DUF3267 domain-containing protein [Anaerolineae bacterium]PWB53071.1 MAG: hypothetical protein C3F13_10670 [Anaerolineales bacterium]